MEGGGEAQSGSIYIMGKQQPLVRSRAGLMGVSGGQLTRTPSCNGHWDVIKRVAADHLKEVLTVFQSKLLVSGKGKTCLLGGWMVHLCGWCVLGQLKIFKNTLWGLLFLMRNNQQLHKQICSFITFSITSYMFWPSIAAIFGGVFLEEYYIEH